LEKGIAEKKVYLVRNHSAELDLHASVVWPENVDIENKVINRGSEMSESIIGVTN